MSIKFEPKYIKIKMFDQIASRYDRINHILSLGIDRLWRKKAACILAEYKPDSVLDIACGTADSSISIHEAIKSAKITGIDISHEMLRLGQEKIYKKGLLHMIKLIEGNAEQIDSEDASYEAVTIFFGFRNFRDRPQALHEIYRVLKPQGILMIVEFSIPRQRLIKTLYKLYLFHMLPVIGGILSGKRYAYRYFVQSVKTFPAPEMLYNQLYDNGFIIKMSKPLTGGIAWIYLAEKDNVVLKI